MVGCLRPRSKKRHVGPVDFESQPLLTQASLLAGRP